MVSQGPSPSALNLKRGNTRPLSYEFVNRKKAREIDSSLLFAKAKPPTIRFAADSQIFEIPSRMCLSKQELNDVYMNREDQNRIYNEIAEIIRAVKAGEVGDVDDVCKVSASTVEENDDDGLRGLETILEQRGSDRSERLKTAIAIVVLGQQNIDESWLEQHYRPLSDLSARLARQRAIRDHENSSSIFPRQIVMSR